MIYLSIRNFRKGFVGTGKVRKVMKYKIMEYDDVLKLYEADLDLRVNDYHKKGRNLLAQMDQLWILPMDMNTLVYTEHQRAGFTVSGHLALPRCIWQVSSMVGITESIQWSV